MASNNTSGTPNYRRLLWFTLLFVGLSLAGVYTVYHQLAGQALQWDRRLLSPAALLGYALLLLVYFCADGLRLWFTLRALGERVPMSAMARLVFLNIFVSNVTPLATGGGFAQVWFLRRHGVAIGTAMTATTIRTVLAVLFIFGATPVLLLTLPGAEAAAQQSSLIPTLIVCVVLYLSFFAVLLLRPSWLARPLLLVLKLLQAVQLISAHRQRRWRYRLVRELRRFAQGFGQYFSGRWRDILASWLFTALFLLSLFSFPAVLLWALGYDLEYWLVIGRMVITTFIMYFSPTPGASGIAEGVFGHLFSDVLTVSHLVLVTVGWRVLTIYLGLLIGLFVTHRELTDGVRP
ncbi:lysylphosphatidylglycerol synthase transmembrane domain-containing protein [Saccharospirillum mangrovi]|uniref:lysylphosphatidylglycerol synthase transmembrane domain-containing protein n=1 Tax=Saccharospirillum mangrovi TaxID=2161747 RepID=UPI000D3D3456|nr:lysylphosphatidylglycerol synthase transmembrane domain-containing protein [Saccharospirillum mangrovi]